MPFCECIRKAPPVVTEETICHGACSGRGAGTVTPGLLTCNFPIASGGV